MQFVVIAVEPRRTELSVGINKTVKRSKYSKHGMNCSMEIRGVVPLLSFTKCEHISIGWHAEFECAEEKLENPMNYQKLDVPVNG